VLAHDAPEEVVEAWDSVLLGGLVSGLIGDRGGLGATQAAAVVVLGVAVGVGQDYAVLRRPRGSNGGRWRKLAAVGVERMAEGLGWSPEVGLGLRAELHRGAVFVVVHIAVVALLGAAADAQLVADLVD